MDEINGDVIYLLIYNVLSQHAVKANWKIIFSLISTFVKTRSQQCHMLKCKYFCSIICRSFMMNHALLFPVKLEDLFNQTLLKSITTLDFPTCKATLLVFRHCCLEIGLWSEYSRWYSSYKPNVDTAKIFYALLTELLPYDLPAALAAHINTVINL